MTQSVRVAVVGYGYWGSKHVRVLSTMPDVEVVIVEADRDRRAEARRHFPGARAAADLGDVLGRVDGVVVATPPTTHARIAAEVLRAGRHVLVEKPLATSVGDAEALVGTAELAGKRLMVGHTFEYHAAVWRLREIIRCGELGRVLYIDTARLNLGLYQRDVNVIWDLAPHDISIVSFLLGELPSSVATWAHHNLGGRHADVAYLRLQFARAGVPAFVHVSWLDPQKVRRVTVVGDRKMAVYNDMLDTDRLRVHDVGVDPVDDGAAEAHAMPMTYRAGDIVSPHIPLREPLLVQDTHFVDCVRTGGRPDTSGARGVDIVRVLTATDRGGGRPVPVLPEVRPAVHLTGASPGESTATNGNRVPTGGTGVATTVSEVR